MSKEINTISSITYTFHIQLKKTRLKGEAVLGHVMEAYMVSRVTSPLLNLAVDGSE